MNYDFVATLRSILWSIAALVVSLGLLAYALAAIDRVLSRRREVVALQLIGTPAALLRWTQWLEAAVPTGFGSVLAVGAGLFAGHTLLAIDDSAPVTPWPTALLLGLISLAAAAVVALLTVAASSPRLRPDTIRSE